MNGTIFTFFYGYAHTSSALDTAIIFIARDVGFVILTALLVYLYKHKDNREGVKDLFIILATAVAAWLIAHWAKDVFHTLRPFDALPWVDPLISETGFAFPSGHATFFMTLASMLWYYHKYLGLFFGFSAVIIGIARIATGVHWPVDILGGLFLGLAIGTTAYKLGSSLLEKMKVVHSRPE